MESVAGKTLSHKTVDFAWLQNQALDDESKSALQTMQEIREKFITTGMYPEADKEIILRLCEANLATTLNCSYSTLYAYQEIFLHREHRYWGHSGSLKGTVVDAGANEGLYAIAVCKANPDVSVYCVEPNPISLARLRKNLELNNLLQRCHIIPAALWSHPGRQKLKYLPFVTTNASLQGVSAKSRWLLTPTVRSVIVEATTLDGLLELFHLTEVAILKIDIEGSEVEALRGATQTLMKTKRVVIEYHSDLLRQEAIEIMENDKHFQLKHETRDKVHATQSCGNLYFWRNEAE